MRTTLALTIATAALSIASTAWSQTANTSGTAAKPDMAASMPQDCKDMMGKTAQGDAKGMGMNKDMPCGVQGAASGAAAKKRLKHDHTKFHKNQG